MVEVDDAACTWVHAWRSLLSKPHMIVPVYLYVMNDEREHSIPQRELL